MTLVVEGSELYCYGREGDRKSVVSQASCRMEWTVLDSGLGLMRWSLLPNSLRPFKIYCASPSITSQLVLFLWQTVEIDPLGDVRVVEALQKFFQKCDPVILSEIHFDIAGVQQFHCR